MLPRLRRRTARCASTSASAAASPRCSATTGARSSCSTRCCSRCPGTPVIYYGDEIGMGDNVYLGDRDGVRTPMQWIGRPQRRVLDGQPAPPVPAADHRAGLPLRERQRGDPGGQPGVAAVVDAPADRPAQAPPRARARHDRVPRPRQPPRARVRPLPTPRWRSEQPLLCVANLSRLAQQVELDLRRFGGVGARRGVRPEPLRARSASGRTTLTLAPYGFFWFALDSRQTHRSRRRGRPAASWRGRGRTSCAGGRRSARAIGRWLPGRRWFAGKGAIAPRSSPIDDVVELSESRRPRRRADVVHRGRRPPVLRAAAAHDGRARRGARPAPPGVGHRPARRRRRRRRDERARGSRCRRRRGAAAAHSAGPSSVAIGHPRRPGLTKLAADPHDVHVLGVEQSNSSAIVGGRVIAKLIRRLTPGENPDVTLPMHLRSAWLRSRPRCRRDARRAARQATPRRTSSSSTTSSANEADLWEWSQDLLTREVERLVSEPESTADDAVMAAVTGLLAERTAEMHLGLAGGAPGFEPEPFSLLWQRSMLQSLRASLRETQRLVRRSRSSLADAGRCAGGGRARRRRPAARRVRRAADAQARRRAASGSTAICTSVRRCGPATTSCSSTSRASRARRSASARSSARR